ncbi:universal stress protein G-like [Gigantopelta aegis]|uniref:universal stress protein G-like n=1 Tax=Gigantopelta aegis TaxID=1735272 RepID=UPI001B888A3B|nr:universal stress protein G-like [Gigantopelta aegis]
MAQTTASGGTNVVICLDNSPYSEKAIEWYISFFHRPDHHVHLVHVLEWWGDVGRMMSPQRIHELVQETDQKAEDLGKRFVQLFQSKGISSVDFHKVHGKDVWHEIIECATKVHAKLIVIGSRGQGTIRRTLMGSNSDAVVHHSHIPVVVCKINE